MTLANRWAFAQHQADVYVARARADDRRPRPTLLARLAAWATPDPPTAHDYQLAELAWPAQGDRRTWAELGAPARRRLAYRAMPYRRALEAAQSGAAS